MNISRSSNVTRSSKQLGTALSLAAALLLGACAPMPSQPESSPTAAEPPLISGSAAAGTAGAAPAPVELQPDHPQTYTVAPGDTLWNIAQRHPGITVDQLKELNADALRDGLQPGKRLRVARPQG